MKIADIQDNKDRKIEENIAKEVITQFLFTTILEKNNLYKLVDRIEIDKDKNIYIHFTFQGLNMVQQKKEES